MSEVHQVTAIVSNPSRRDFGRATVGYYLIEGNLLTMAYGDGKPYHGRSGERITHKLQAGEDPGIVAKRLTMKIYRMVRGDGMAGFTFPLSPRPEVALYRPRFRDSIRTIADQVAIS